MLQLIEHEITIQDPEQLERALSVVSGLRLVAQSDPVFARETIESYRRQGKMDIGFSVGLHEAGVFNGFLAEGSKVFGLIDGLRKQRTTYPRGSAYPSEEVPYVDTGELVAILPKYKSIYSRTDMPTRIILNDTLTMAKASILTITANSNHYPREHKINKIPRSQGSSTAKFHQLSSSIQRGLTADVTVAELDVAFDAVAALAGR